MFSLEVSGYLGLGRRGKAGVTGESEKHMVR